MGYKRTVRKVSFCFHLAEQFDEIEMRCGSTQVHILAQSLCLRPCSLSLSSVVITQVAVFINWKVQSIYRNGWYKLQKIYQYSSLILYIHLIELLNRRMAFKTNRFIFVENLVVFRMAQSENVKNTGIVIWKNKIIERQSIERMTKSSMNCLFVLTKSSKILIWIVQRTFIQRSSKTCQNHHKSLINILTSFQK